MSNVYENRIRLQGFLGGDVEPIFSKDDDKRVIAYVVRLGEGTRSRKDDEGKWNSVTQWHTCKYYVNPKDPNPESCKFGLGKKGDLASLEGKLIIASYTNQETGIESNVFYIKVVKYSPFIPKSLYRTYWRDGTNGKNPAMAEIEQMEDPDMPTFGKESNADTQAEQSNSDSIPFTGDDIDLSQEEINNLFPANESSTPKRPPLPSELNRNKPKRPPLPIDKDSAIKKKAQETFRDWLIEIKDVYNAMNPAEKKILEKDYWDAALRDAKESIGQPANVINQSKKNDDIPTFSGNSYTDTDLSDSKIEEIVNAMNS